VSKEAFKIAEHRIPLCLQPHHTWKWLLKFLSLTRSWTNSQGGLVSSRVPDRREEGGREGRRGTFLEGTSHWSAGRVQQQPAALRESDCDGNNQFLLCAWVEHTSSAYWSIHFFYLWCTLCFFSSFSSSPDVAVTSSMSTLGGMSQLKLLLCLLFSFNNFNLLFKSVCGRNIVFFNYLCPKMAKHMVRFWAFDLLY